MILGEKENITNYHNTSVFVKIVCTWWEIVNVKTPFKGKRLNNKYQHPLTLENSASRQYLEYFTNWLERWHSLEGTAGKLTKETYTAILHSCHALLELADYCLNELNAKYVLLGKFQTDCLEARFGQYRQLSGGKYDVSLRQVYESEKKIRMLSVLKLKLDSKEITLSNFKLDWKDFSQETGCDSINFSVELSSEDRDSAREYIPVITYIAGYCCFAVSKKLQCDFCKIRMENRIGDVQNIENSLITGMTRGRLLYPSQDIIEIVLVNYLTITSFATIMSSEVLLRSANLQ